MIPESAAIWVARASRGREYLIQYHREYLQGWGPGRGECGHFLAGNAPGVLAGAGRVWLLGVLPNMVLHMGLCDRLCAVHISQMAYCTV